MDIKSELYAFIDRAIDGQGEVDDALVEEFGEACKHALRRQLTEQPETEHRFRISSIGKPLCQQQYHKMGAPKSRFDVSTKMKFIFGDIIEAIVMVLLKSTPLKVESEQENVKHDWKDGTSISGTLDVVVGGKVYDIKSASDFSYKYKFKKGFDTVKQDDPFGYVSQGYLYAKSMGLPFGGWIVVNKNTGDIHVTEAPLDNQTAENEAVAIAKKNMDAINLDLPFQRCFTPQAEIDNKNPSGNLELGVNCRYCEYKEHCWGEQLSFQGRVGPRGGIKAPKWYIGEVIRGTGDVRGSNAN